MPIEFNNKIIKCDVCDDAAVVAHAVRGVWHGRCYKHLKSKKTKGQHNVKKISKQSQV